MWTCTYVSPQHGASPGKLRRGHAEVLADGKVYQYRVPKGQRKLFRLWLETAFAMRGRMAKVAGRFPHYDIDMQ
jgi:hypothetical protein